MDNWLPTLITPTPTEGYDLAVKLSRMAIKKTQPDAAVRDRLRPEYAEDADALAGVWRHQASQSLGGRKSVLSLASGLPGSGCQS